MGAQAKLRQIRELHRPFTRDYPGGDGRTVCNHCLGPVDWPCPTAQLAAEDGVSYPTWRTLDDIPEGATFRTVFDDLVHPMRISTYYKDVTRYRDIADGEYIDTETMRNRWGWVDGFDEVTPTPGRH